MNLIDKIQETKSMKQRALNFTTVLTLACAAMAAAPKRLFDRPRSAGV
jgi:hypothetical protein